MKSEPLDGRDAAAWRAAYREGLPPLAEGCPGDEVLAALVAGELTGTERERAADHVVACPRCAADYRTLGELHAEAAQAEAPRPARRWLAPLAAAAALVLAAGLALFTWGPPRPVGGPPPGDPPRSGAGVAAVSPAAGAVLATAPTELRWAPQPGASAYRLRLFDAAAEPLWEAPSVAAPPLALPAELSGRLRPGSSYFWVVEVEGPVARPRLGPYWFQLSSSLGAPPR